MMFYLLSSLLKIEKNLYSLCLEVVASPPPSLPSARHM